MRKVVLLATLLASSSALTVDASAGLIPSDRGAWEPTGSTSVMRADHTATLLADGRVFVAGGGYLEDGTLAPTEIWDPRTGQFRSGATQSGIDPDTMAALLTDGRVLLVGADRWSRSWFAETWDPRTDSLTPVGSVPNLSTDEDSVLMALPDGRAVVFGNGAETGCETTFVAEVWDPATGRFHRAGSTPKGRHGYTATSLRADGRILFTGGGALRGHGGDPQRATCGWRLSRDNLAPSVVWDPATESFGVTGPMDTNRWSHTATELADGRVLVAGGHAAEGEALLSEIWDPSTGRFTPAATLETRREADLAVLLTDGRILMTSGDGEDPLSTLLWSPESQTFSVTGSLGGPHLNGAQWQTGATLTELTDGRALIIGGRDTDGNGRTAAELFSFR